MLSQENLWNPDTSSTTPGSCITNERYEDAVRVFRAFLQEPDGWVENKIDACLHLALCEEHLGHTEKAVEALFKKLYMTVPAVKPAVNWGG